MPQKAWDTARVLPICAAPNGVIDVSLTSVLTAKSVKVQHLDQIRVKEKAGSKAMRLSPGPRRP
jgi:muconolactone delta-isomerase